MKNYKKCKMIGISVLVTLLFCFVQWSEGLQSTPDDLYPYPTNGRLPTWIRPSHYNLSFGVDLENASYTAAIEISFEVVNATDKIVLNMLDIVTLNETCKVALLPHMKTVGIKKQTYDRPLQFYVIHLNKALLPGETGIVSFEFRGTLNTLLVGFYLSKYKNAQGKEIRVASTQFSPTDARRAFPCFDEPNFKATFDISIERDNKTRALSNMPLKETVPVSDNPDRFVDRFERTVKMSTYLVGFIVSDFEYQSSSALNNTEFRVWSRKEALEQTSYALEVGPKLLRYLEDYFGAKYPLPKLDMAAVPNFKFRGMENWGLILYRESALLFDPLVSSIESKRNIIRVVSHEIAHMWFGNLVTPKWWSELWLKEGFANFMGFKAVDDIEPSWKMMDYLVQSSTHSALLEDSLKFTHPINVHVDHPDRISEIFDTISYNKGASLIRMMEHFLSEATFKQGMQAYIHDLKYENAEQEDLWRFLDHAWRESVDYSPERTVQHIMDTWTLQEGYPVVTATNNDSAISLTQERFLLKEEGNESIGESLDQEKWWIPVTFTRGSTPSFQVTRPSLWIPPTDEHVLHNESVNTEEWFLLNVQKTGFYRVNYDWHNWVLLTKQLLDDHTVIHNLNRAQLLDDSLNLAKAGRLNYSIPLSMGLYMRNETDLTAWKIFVSNFAFIYDMFKTSQEAELLDNYLLDLITNLYSITGFKESSNKSFNIQALTPLAVKWACDIGHKDCLETSNSLFNQWLELSNDDNSSLIPSNVKSTVLCVGMKNASVEIWNKLFQLYLTSNVQTDKTTMLGALACINDTEILSRYLNMSLDPSSGILKQDVPTVFEEVSTSVEGRDLAWGVVKEKWEYILQYFGSGSPYGGRILESVTQTFNNEVLLKEFEDFKTKQMGRLGSAKRPAEIAQEKIDINTQWMKTHYSEVREWINSSYKVGSKCQYVYPNSLMICLSVVSLYFH